MLQASVWPQIISEEKIRKPSAAEPVAKNPSDNLTSRNSMVCVRMRAARYARVVQCVRGAAWRAERVLHA